MRAHIEEILSFWFGLARSEPRAVPAQMERWFGGARDEDELIRRRFQSDFEAAVAGRYDAWEEIPRGCLALIILFDQFPRQLFRGRPEAFAYDARAQRLVLDGVQEGFDEQLCPLERGFFYMPLQHAEILPLQEKSVELFQRLYDDAAEDWRPHLKGMLDYAIEHRDIIRRFGRFPHRNAILGRGSTPEEEAYLAGGAPNYGQQ